jgi:hypothetical protein
MMVLAEALKKLLLDVSLRLPVGACLRKLLGGSRLGSRGTPFSKEGVEESPGSIGQSAR